MGSAEGGQRSEELAGAAPQTVYAAHPGDSGGQLLYSDYSDSGVELDDGRTGCSIESSLSACFYEAEKYRNALFSRLPLEGCRRGRDMLASVKRVIFWFVRNGPLADAGIQKLIFRGSVLSLPGGILIFYTKKVPTPQLLRLQNQYFKCAFRGSNPGHPD